MVIERTAREIDLIREYVTRLIADEEEYSEVDEMEDVADQDTTKESEA